MKQKLVLIGNGMAGVRTLEELLKIAPDHYDITVFGAEPFGNYNRILLSPVLTGEKSLQDIMLNDVDWYRDNGIVLRAGETITTIDRARRTVTTADGERTPYDRLIVATGSKPVIIPVPGAQLPGVITFRDIHDVNAMLAAVGHYRNAVVIGGGLLGLEAAYGLKERGMSVSVVHLLDTLMERQLDRAAATLLREELERKGLAFLMEAQTEAFIGEERVRAVRFKDGREIPADIVVMAVGIRPNVQLAKDAGIHCNRGVVVNDTMQTFDPRVYAVGECVEHRSQTYGLVAPLFEMAKVCANHLAGVGYARYVGSVPSTKLKVTGIDVFSAGRYLGGGDCEDILLTDTRQNIYKKLVVSGNRVVGAVLFGNTVDSGWYLQLIKEHTDISAIRDQLMFGQANIGDAGHGAQSSVAAMSDATEVCGCNGVCKGTIREAIITKGLFTLEDVRAHTKASASCGSCTGLVEQLLVSTLGSDYSQAPARKPLCACSDFTHDEVRKVIREQDLNTVEEVMRFLEWRKPDGCHVCRPAINYYLISSRPDAVRDDYQSRFVNERVHANIQKDGSYSVVPRIWGGVVTPSELRAIADVAEEFSVPTVKITGGQRIDLLGVAKTELPAVWRRLNEAGMVSGHAYGKALRTVKTCVGSDWCRFGTQDAIGMGIELEKMCWGSWTPHKVKMAVSGCPRNCAEATIKDFGVVAVDSGWELHVGGNGGVKVRATDLLCKVKTAEEVKEYCGAYLQLYREEARYLERTAPWIERVGLNYVKQRVVDDAAGRHALYERFIHSQRNAQRDPWQERAVGGIDGHEFVPLRDMRRGAVAS